jgi:hypothetical protein
MLFDKFKPKEEEKAAKKSRSSSRSNQKSGGPSGFPSFPTGFPGAASPSAKSSGSTKQGGGGFPSLSLPDISLPGVSLPDVSLPVDVSLPFANPLESVTGPPPPPAPPPPPEDPLEDLGRTGTQIGEQVLDAASTLSELALARAQLAAVRSQRKAQARIERGVDNLQAVPVKAAAKAERLRKVAPFYAKAAVELATEDMQRTLDKAKESPEELAQSVTDSIRTELQGLQQKIDGAISKTKGR